MYRAPVKDLRFVLDELIGTEQIARLPGIRRLFAAKPPKRSSSEAARFAESGARAALQERRSRGRAVVAATA